MDKGQIYQCYLDLLKEYGEACVYWPEWCAKEKTEKDREIIAIGAILVQRTTWHNADLALRNLKKEGLLRIKSLATMDAEPLGQIIRSAGFYQSKPERIIELSKLLERGIDNVTREELLAIKGIGKETADTILLYAADKPVFVIDEYTKRFVTSKGWDSNLDYDYLQQLFENNLSKEVGLFQNYHALIIVAQRGKVKSKMELI